MLLRIVVISVAVLALCSWYTSNWTNTNELSVAKYLAADLPLGRYCKVLLACSSTGCTLSCICEFSWLVKRCTCSLIFWVMRLRLSCKSLTQFAVFISRDTLQQKIPRTIRQTADYGLASTSIRSGTHEYNNGEQQLAHLYRAMIHVRSLCV